MEIRTEHLIDSVVAVGEDGSEESMFDVTYSFATSEEQKLRQQKVLQAMCALWNVSSDGLKKGTESLLGIVDFESDELTLRFVKD